MGEETNTRQTCNGGSEGRGQPRRCPTCHKITFLAVVAEILTVVVVMGKVLVVSGGGKSRCWRSDFLFLKTSAPKQNRKLNRRKLNQIKPNQIKPYLKL
jgi:hypothetical protein